MAIWFSLMCSVHTLGGACTHSSQPGCSEWVCPGAVCWPLILSAGAVQYHGRGRSILEDGHYYGKKEQGLLKYRHC